MLMLSHISICILTFYLHLLHATSIKRGLLSLPDCRGCQVDLYFPANRLVSVYWVPLVQACSEAIELSSTCFILHA